MNDGITAEKQDESHVPVLATDVLGWLACGPDRTYVDCTVGAGALAARILERTAPGGVLLGIDRDAEAIARSRARLTPFGSRVRLVQGDFADLKAHVAAAGLQEVHGVVFDLGLSSPQLDAPDRGFSFAAEGPLDMRMDRSTGPTAADLVARLPEAELADVMARYGEERFARRIARAIVRARRRAPIRTTGELVAVIRDAVPAPARHGRIHLATRTFQALRIAVNQELDVLAPALRDAATLVAPGGRLCVISFHSLEDRIVKRTFADLSRAPSPWLRLLTKKPHVPTDAERTRNPRARSAKLRVAERVPAPEGDPLCA